MLVWKRRRADAAFRKRGFSEIGSVFAAVRAVFWAEIMAKPDPIPTFIEVGSLVETAVPAETMPDKPVEMDWVDEFLCDREIRPNTALE